MPSPTCEVKEGAGSYQATTNGFDATPSATVTIHLVSSAGVNTWEIECIGTDELSDVATVNAGRTIDTAAKTCAFTAPISGRAYIFQSRINGGVDSNGVSQPTYTTTFGIYTLAAASRRVHAVNETFESHPTFGWLASHNDLIRNPSSAAPGGTSGQVQINAGGFGAISHGAVGSVLRQTGATTQGFGQLDLADTDAVTGLLPLTNQAAPTSTGLAKVSAGSWSAAASTLVNADVNAAAAIDGTKISPNFGSQTISTTGSATIDTALTVGTSAATTGTIRLPNGVIIRAKNASAVDKRLIEFDSSNIVRIGESAGAIVLHYSGTCGAYNGTGYDLLVTQGSNIALGLPLIGNSTTHALSGRATQAMADANQTLASSIYSRSIIRFTGALTAGRTATFPHPSGEDESYVKWIVNDCTGGFSLTCSTGTGTTVNVGSGTKAMLSFTPGGVSSH